MAGTMRVVVWVGVLLLGSTCADYWEDRTRFIEDERNMFLGAEIVLGNKEIVVNDILMKAKREEYSKGFSNINGSFAPAIHFFNAKQLIEQSEVFKFIQKMPKGAQLHGHDMAMASTVYLVENVTYRDNLYACVDAQDNFRLHFFETPDDLCNWTLVSVMREFSGDVETFDAWLGQKLSLVVKNPHEVYPDINSVWLAFDKLFIAAFSMLTYRPVFEDYFTQVLTEFYEDNVMYIEFRATMEGVYELNGTVLTSLETASIYNSVVNRFVQTHPRFLGARVIYAPYRRVDNATVLNYLDEFNLLRTALPNFVAGFDLVGQEDLGNPLSKLIEPLLKFQKDGAHFFFHAGETNWQGETDMNIIDAILLNTTRIGHGFALTKHPLALKMVKERGIAIEVNPLSNQVLKLVGDLRNHPAAALLADNYPVVIGSDDPSFWGAKGLSYDFYAAFMGLSGLHADIRVLKKLAMNSLQYSSMPAAEKINAFEAWETEWELFTDSMIQNLANLIPSPSNKHKLPNRSPLHLIKENVIKIELI